MADRSIRRKQSGAEAYAGRVIVVAANGGGEQSESNRNDESYNGDVETQAGSSIYVDPDSGSSGDDARTGERKRRGRKPGVKNRKTVSETTQTLEAILYSAHLMASNFLRIPELALTEDESKLLSAAVLRVSELYELPLLNEKAMAWINLTLVAGTIYGPRIVAAGRKPKSMTAFETSAS